MYLIFPNSTHLLRAIFIAFSILIPVVAGAQVMRFDYEEYNTKNGLSQNAIQCIAQDKSGYMWFGTEEGLNRFDGYEFRVFVHNDKDPSSIVGNSIRTFMVDDDGSIWIGTSNGVCRYFPETEFIEHFPVDFTDESKLNGAYVSSIKKRTDGSIWISYGGSGVDVIYPNEKNIFHYTVHRNDEYKLQNDMVNSILFMKDGTTIFGGYSGLEILDKKRMVLKEDEAIKIYPWKEKIGKGVKCMVLSNNGRTLWIGTELDGVYKVDLKDNKIRNFNLENSELTSKDIRSIYEDSKGNIWIGSDALYQYDQDKDNVIWYNQKGMYIKNHTNAIIEDKDENLWMGTSRLGIRKIDYKSKEVSHFHGNQGEGSVKSDEILAFNEDDDGDIWVGTGGAGLTRMSKDNKRFEDAPINSQLSSLTIKCIFKDTSGTFWIGCWDGGLVKYHPKTNALEQFHPKYGNFNSHHVWDIEGDKEGNLWLGTLRDGLCHFSTVTKKYRYYSHTPGDSNALVNNDVLCVKVDSREIVWVGTANGLSLLYPGSDKFKSFFKFQSNQENFLSNSIIKCISEDVNGKMWLGTKGGGITVVKVENGEMVVEKNILEGDGLPGNTVNFIQSDKDNNIWVSTNNGLAKINPYTFNILPIPPDLALKETEFLGGAGFKASDGRIFLGSSFGFYMFNPDNLQDNIKKPEVVFTTLKVVNDIIAPNKLYRDRIILTKSIDNSDQINLTYEDYAVTIQFSPLIFNLQNNLHYSFFLENLDKEWQYSNSEKRFVHYTNLAPGTYILKVKVSYDGKNWPDSYKSLKIVVSPPWWSAWWFKIGLLTLIISVVFLIFKIRLRFLENQRHKLEDLVLLRTKELNRSNCEIQSLLEEVAQQKSTVEIKNQELQEVNEEVKAQRDNLVRKSCELEKTQEELQDINMSLEELVKKRTDILNNTLLELETFLYRASHDLQGPISTMQGLISLAKLEQEANIPVCENYPALIESSVIKLDKTLKNLLQKHAIHKIKVSISSLGKKEIVELVDQVLVENKLSRKADMDLEVEDNIHVETDCRLLKIILTALLENAFFYSQNAENKKVRLRFSKENAQLVFSVKDFGCGIKKEHHDKIYTMFFRGNEISKGNGLGLYLVKNVLFKLNGSIDLDTEEGKYTEFTVKIPN